jgi:anti-sigma factor RsiW
MNITRDVVIDLWPAYQAGEVSVETRALVDEFLASDPEFASILKKMGDARRLLQEAPPTDDVRNERRTLEKARGRVLAQWLMLAAAVIVSGLVVIMMIAVLFLFLPGGRVGVPEIVLFTFLGGVLLAMAAAFWWAFSRLAKD